MVEFHHIKAFCFGNEAEDESTKYINIVEKSNDKARNINKNENGEIFRHTPPTHLHNNKYLTLYQHQDR